MNNPGRSGLTLRGSPFFAGVVLISLGVGGSRADRPSRVRRTALAPSEGVVESGGLRFDRLVGTIQLLVLDGWAVVDRGVQSLLVEPPDPLGGLTLDLVAACPPAGGVQGDQLGLVQPDRGLHERVIQSIAN